MRALDALETEKNINKEELIEAVEFSIAQAYKKNYGNVQEVDAHIDRETGEIAVFVNLHIVDEVLDPEEEISLEEARETDPTYEVGDILRKKVTPKDFGRIAAQNAKQLIVQRIKEAERNLIYNELMERKDEIMTGTVKRIDPKGNVRVDIGIGGDAVMNHNDQTKGEVYEPGKRMKVYLTDVRRTTRGTQVNVSRSHYGLVKRLFESEVPEIYDGIVDVKTVARAAGNRTKIAVKANNPDIDPLGACVGPKGMRVQSIINELGGEKIDIIRYSDVAEEYIENALSPAKVKKVFANKEERTAIVIVDDLQLSLAIGKEGQNVRLAARVTGWRIDLKSESQYQELLEEDPEFLERFMAAKTPDVEDEKDLDDVLDIQIDENETDDVLDALFVEDTHTEMDDLDALFKED